MTLRAINSFQYHRTGWSIGGSVNATGGQNGLPSLRFTSGSTQSAIYSTATFTHIIVGFCHRVSSIDTGGIFLRLNLSGAAVFNLAVNGDGSISAIDESGTDVERGVTVSGVLQSNVETYIEARILLSTTVGEVEIRTNGSPTPVLDISGVDTGGASANQIIFVGSGNQGTRDFSAWYYLDVDATAPNDFLGHIRFACLDPIGNGNSSGFAGSDGNSTDNYLLVDDGATATTNDGDTTYVEHDTVGTKDTYAMEDLPTAPLSIIAVAPIFIAKKTDAGSRAIMPVIRSGGTDYPGDAAFLSTSYAAYSTIFLENPDGPAAWDEASVNGMEVGMEVDT